MAELFFLGLGLLIIMNATGFFTPPKSPADTSTTYTVSNNPTSDKKGLQLINLEYDAQTPVPTSPIPTASPIPIIIQPTNSPTPTGKQPTATPTPTTPQPALPTRGCPPGTTPDGAGCRAGGGGGNTQPMPQ